MKRIYPLALVTVITVSVIGWKAATQTAVWKPKPRAAGAVRVLLVTGGHDHDVEFYSAFDDVDPHPMAFSGNITKRAG